MKILVLSNLYPPDVIGGYEIACKQVVDKLRERQHDVLVLTSAPRMPVPHVPHVHRLLKFTNTWDGAYLEKAFAITQRLAHVNSHFVHAANVQTLLHTLEHFQPDVVYLHNLIGLGGLGMLAALMHMGVPWVWQLGDCVPKSLCSRWDGPVPELVQEFGRRVSGHYICVSQQLAEEIREQGIALQGHVEVIPNWIIGQRPPARTRFYQGGTLRILTAGQIAYEKGIGILIDTAKLLRDSGRTDFLIDIYGRVNDYSFQSLVDRQNLSNWVKFRGPKQHAELMGLYSEYDVFAFPTWEREPFGLVPIEAGARGCVPVMTQRCGVAEYLVHQVHCLKAPRNPESFAGVLGEIMDRKIALEPIAKRITAAAWDEFHIDHVAPRIEAVFERAARAPRPPAGNAMDAYGIAQLGERMALVMVHEAMNG